MISSGILLELRDSNAHIIPYDFSVEMSKLLDIFQI